MRLERQLTQAEFSYMFETNTSWWNIICCSLHLWCCSTEEHDLRCSRLNTVPTGAERPDRLYHSLYSSPLNKYMCQSLKDVNESVMEKQMEVLKHYKTLHTSRPSEVDHCLVSACFHVCMCLYTVDMLSSIYDGS